jgi:hypothetical protein
MSNAFSRVLPEKVMEKECSNHEALVSVVTESLPVWTVMPAKTVTLGAWPEWST